MSNMLAVLDSNSQLPAHLQGQNLGVTAGILATMGATGNRIGLKGSRFRVVLNGKEEQVVDENYLDVIIVGVVPHISRMYYEGEYNSDTKARPTCFSENGIAPPEDLPTRQSDKCDSCKWNEKGSKIANGQKMKACGFFQRLVVMFPGDDSRTYYKLDVKSQGIFGDSHPKINKFNIREYGKVLANRGIDASLVVTRLSFDTDSSVPKLLFGPQKFVEESDFEAVKEAVASEEVKNLLKISMATVDLSNEESSDGAEETPRQPAQEPESKQEAPRQPAPKPAPKPEPEQPKQYRGVKEKLGDFTVQDYLNEGWTKEQLLEQGMIEEYKPEPPKPSKPAAPPAPAKPAAPPKPKPAPAPAAVVESVPAPGAAAPVQEVTTDAELNDLIAGLL